MGTLPTVFLSYAHADGAWKDRFAEHLVSRGLSVLIDISGDDRIAAGADWRAAIEGSIARASVALLLVSPAFLASRFIRDEEVPKLLQRRQYDGLFVLPVLIAECGWKTQPWLARIQLWPRDGRVIAQGSRAAIDVDLAAITDQIAARIASAPTVTRGHTPPPLPPERVSLSRLPIPGKLLFGREPELARLDACWNDPGTHVVSIIAMGGAGKTALVDRWLRELEKEGYRGAERVLGWSFYSQGTRDTAASGDAFIAFALSWFGDADPTLGSPWEKGERLARLVKQHNTLLVLDGMEPLQSQHDEGMITDPGVGTLVRELAAGGRGLCVISSRVVVMDLVGREDTSAPRIDLEQLTDRAGAELLDALNVRGTRDEKASAARDLGGHALAITLLGTYLASAWKGDLRRRSEIGPLTGKGKHGAHAKRVMEAYAKRLGAVELGILGMLGLFDRPADARCIEALRAVPAIAGLTDAITGIDAGAWNHAVRALRNSRLLAEESPGDPGGLDAHPLVREHFGERLRVDAPEAWREGHSRLFDHLQSVPESELPETDAEMAPLYAAVVHGCHAERRQEAFDEVLWKRIRRGAQVFHLTKLGAFGAESTMLAAFFDPPWTRVSPGLIESDQAVVLGAAGFAFRALGRLGEAAGPMRLGLEIARARADWANAAIASSNLSELHLTRGDIAAAIVAARQSIEFADRSGDSFWCVASRTALADALHQAGQISEARAQFEEAEAMQKAMQPVYPFLCSMQGFQYCDLLLGVGEREAVLQRAQSAVVIALLDIALDHLTLGRAHLLLAARGGDHLVEAAKHLAEAVADLRGARTQHHLPRGFLARAALHIHTGDLPAATHDLAETLSLAARCGMRLFEADAHLGFTRLHLATSPPNLPAAHKSLTAAGTLIATCGYHRRDAELAALEAELAAAQQP